MKKQTHNSTVLLFTSVTAAMLMLGGAGCAVKNETGIKTDLDSAIITNDQVSDNKATQPTGTDATNDTPSTTVNVTADDNVMVADPKKVVVKKNAVVKSVYKNGTYTAVGSYNSPAGPEQIGITLTIKDDIITDATAQVKAENRKSEYMQNDFASNFKVMVVGKNINDVSLTKVSGSSLTPEGFNDAVAKIKLQARA